MYEFGSWPGVAGVKNGIQSENNPFLTGVINIIETNGASNFFPRNLSIRTISPDVSFVLANICTVQEPRNR
jgi:hypothetical protein